MVKWVKTEKKKKRKKKRTEIQSARASVASGLVFVKIG